MKALFLGRVATDTFAGIKDELPKGLDTEVIDDPIDKSRITGDFEILVSNHWRAEYPAAPGMRLVQSVATGTELFDLAAMPKGVSVCNSFGHETAIAEHIIMP
jgi:hypothetical protein